jgi:hypothetical protein
MLRLLGPLVTLLLVQSKGWPFVVCWWAILDFALLYGSGRLAKHWFYWQETVGLFNEENPSGHVVDSVWNTRILTIAITVSVCVVLKRFVVGLYLGRQTFGEYHHVECSSNYTFDSHHDGIMEQRALWRAARDGNE